MIKISRLILSVLLGVGIVFFTWLYARIIYPELLYADTPHSIMFVFSVLSFLIWAVFDFLLFKKTTKADKSKYFIRVFVSFFAILALTTLSIQLQVPYWLSRSSTSVLIFIFYIPYVLLSIFTGAILGWFLVTAKNKFFEKTSPIVLYTLTIILFIGVNIHFSNYGRFSLAPIVGVVKLEAKINSIFLKRDFINSPLDIGGISSITNLRCSTEGSGTLVIAGRSGAVLLTYKGKLKQTIKFDKIAGFYVYPIDIDNDGLCEFIDVAGGWQPVGLFDNRGRKQFSYGKKYNQDKDLIEIEYSTQDAIAFDLGGDGIKELLIPLLVVGKKLTHVVNRNGKLIKSLSMNLEGCASVSENSINRLVCLQNNMGGAFVTIYDQSLEAIKKFSVKFPGRNKKVKIIRWPDLNGAWHILYKSPEGLSVANLDTGVISVASRNKALSYSNTWFVKFDASNAAFTVSIKSMRGTVTIYIYTASGELVYQETVRQGGVVSILPQPDGSEHFLISERLESGNYYTLMEYQLNKTTIEAN